MAKKVPKSLIVYYQTDKNQTGFLSLNDELGAMTYHEMWMEIVAKMKEQEKETGETVIVTGIDKI